MSLGDNILIDEAMIGSGLVYNRPGRVSEAYRAWLEAAVLEKERAEDQAWAQWDGIQREPTSTGAGVYLIPPGSDYQHAPPGTFPPGQCCPPDPMNLPYTDVTSDSLDTTPVRERIATGDWFTGDLALAEAEAMTGDLAPADERIVEGSVLQAMAGLGLRGLGAFATVKQFEAVYQGFRGAMQQPSGMGHMQAMYAQARSLWAQMTPNERGQVQAEMHVMASTVGDRSVYSSEVAADPSVTTGSSLQASRQRAVTAKAALDAARARGGESVFDHLPGELERMAPSADTVSLLGKVAVVAGGLAAAAWALKQLPRRSNPRRRRRR